MQRLLYSIATHYNARIRTKVAPLAQHIMRKRCGTILLAAAITLSCPAKAESTLSAGYLLGGCRDAIKPGGADTSMTSLCIGAMDTLFALRHVLPPHLTFCAPDLDKTQSSHRAYEIVVEFVQAEQGYGIRHQQPFSIVALQALRNAWPCVRH
jgi:hypothetical protein